MTNFEIAYAQHDWNKAQKLAAAAYAANPAAERSREIELQAMLENGHMDEAEKQSNEWLAAKPGSVYALLTAAEVQFRKGEWRESYVTDAKALALDPCSPYILEDMANYENLAGYRGTAEKHLTAAHALAPQDELIARRWADSLPDAQQLPALIKIDTDSKVLTEKQRAKRLQRLEHTEALSQATCSLASSSGAAVVTLVPVDTAFGKVYDGIEVEFNGRKRILQLHTGVSRFLLTRAGSNGLNLRKVADARVGAEGDEGSAESEIDVADSIRIGGLQFQNCRVIALEQYGRLGPTNQVGSVHMDSIDGMMGSNVFDHYLVTIDYPHHQLRLEPLPPIPGSPVDAPVDALGGSTSPDWLRVDRYVAPTMKSWTPIYVDGYVIELPARVSNSAGQGPNRIFTLASGTDHNMIDTRLASSVSTLAASNMQFRGPGGTVRNNSVAGKLNLDFAGLRLPVESMDARDFLSHDDISGYIGFPALSQVAIHIDYRDHLLWLEVPLAGK